MLLNNNSRIQLLNFTQFHAVRAFAEVSYSVNAWAIQQAAVASPGFVAKRGNSGNYIMGHSRRTSCPGAAAAL